MEDPSPEEVIIKKVTRMAHGWRFEVVLSDNDTSTKHTVMLDDDFWEKWQDLFEEPTILVKRSFEFLLEHESKQAILATFDLSVIREYFPQYDERLREGLKVKKHYPVDIHDL